MTSRGARDREVAQPILNVLVIARAASGRSQRDVAEQIGCYQHQLHSWETGETMPGLAWISLWAAALGYEAALLSKGGPLPAFTPAQVEAAARAFATATGEDWADPGIYPGTDPEVWRASYRQGALAILTAAMEADR